MLLDREFSVIFRNSVIISILYGLSIFSIYSLLSRNLLGERGGDLLRSSPTLGSFVAYITFKETSIISYK